MSRSHGSPHEGSDRLLLLRRASIAATRAEESNSCDAESSAYGSARINAPKSVALVQRSAQGSASPVRISTRSCIFAYGVAASHAQRTSMYFKAHEATS
jgi:hypothetical protein